MAIHLLPLFSTILFSTTLTYTWNEQLAVIESGVFVGNNGYPRRYVPWTIPGFYNDMISGPSNKWIDILTKYQSLLLRELKYRDIDGYSRYGLYKLHKQS